MKIFVSYAHADEAHVDDLHLALAPLKQIFPETTIWHDGRILAGENWGPEIIRALDEADLILLLISNSFFASEYCWKKEMPRALFRHKKRETVVVPIIVDLISKAWRYSPFAKLQTLPKGALPIPDWNPPKRGWVDVADRLHDMLMEKGLLKKPEEDDLFSTFHKLATAPSSQRNKPAARTPTQRIFHVPRPENPFFTGRDDVLAWIERVFRNSNALFTQLKIAIYGAAGTGKSEAAAQYAHRYRDNYQVVWWVDAETAASRDDSFIGLATAIALPGADARDISVTRAAVLRWMEQATNWLVIFDNVESPTDLQPWLPSRVGGHLLITSRDDAWRGVAEARNIETWDILTAAAYLRDRSGDEDMAAAQALAAELGGMPLACEHAATYVEDSGSSLAGYLSLLKQRFDKAAEPVFRTFTLAIEKAAEEAPLAEVVMNICACLAPEPIPRILFSGEEGLRVLSSLSPLGRGQGEGGGSSAAPGAGPLPSHPTAAPPTSSQRGEVEEPSPVDAFALNEAFAALRRQALILGQESLTLHRLVQAAARSRLTDKQKWNVTALTLTAKAFPYDSDDARTWDDCARLRPHAETLLAAVPDAVAPPGTADLLCNQLGLYLRECGDYTAALALYERNLQLREKHYGPNDGKTATALSNLGGLLQSMGHLEEAECHTRRALQIDEGNLGADHEEVATDLSNLAVILNDQKRYVEAEPLLRRALEIAEAAFGPDHPDVAVRLSNLGFALSGQGKHGEAKPLQERALKITQMHYGDEHPMTATAYGNLANTLRALGDAAGAVEMHRKALVIRQKWLGPDHPDTQNSRQNLAVAEEALRQGGA
jgi:tetratricopeptide (TPR) repeat protein